MRKTIESQMKFGETDIEAIKFDPRSRDEIPKLLEGLQYIYCTPELHDEVFAILEQIVPEGTDVNNGRPGMELWKILVLGSLRLICNWDYDKLKEIADNHRTLRQLRQMLGHGFDDDDKTYPIQTLKDNLFLLTPEVLDRINQVVVKAGHKLLGKKKEQELKGHCDSFVVETNVHFPTDISLLFDATRKTITLTARLCQQANIPGWRQSGYWIRQVKRLFSKVRKLKHSSAKDEQKKVKRDKKIKKAHQEYILAVKNLLKRVQKDLTVLQDKNIDNADRIQEIEYYIAYAELLIDQIQRRVILGEAIPHSEKVFSVFEPHTEWISKGKAGVPQELGLPVCILKDQYGFTLYHRVMQHETDKDVAIPATKATKERFPSLTGCSYDKGFYAPDNLIGLRNIIDNVVLPKKGRLSVKDREREHSAWFVEARRRHPAVESEINALENHGLDRCPDHGIDGFERYVGLAVVARNLQILGNILQQKKLKRLRRSAA